MTKESVVQAVKGSGGIISHIAKKLDCSWATADKYIKKWKETQSAYEDEKERILDIAEGVLYSSIQDGNTQDAKWLLSTIGKRRGFNEKHEIEHTGHIKILPAPKPKNDS